MKVAICYSGMFRGFDKNVENHITHLISKYDCDVYLNFWDIQGWGGVALKLDTNTNIIYSDEEHNQIVLNRILPVTNDEIDYVKRKLNPIECRIDQFNTFESFVDKDLKNITSHFGPPFMKNILSMYYSIQRCSELIKKDSNYDVILKLRGDLYFSEDIVLTKPANNTIYYNTLGSWDVAINDSLIYGNYETMKIYHNLYNNLYRLWEECGTYAAPEILLTGHLSNNNVKVIKENFYYRLKRWGGRFD